MQYIRKDNRLDIKLIRDFNLMTARKIEKLAEGVAEIYIDLSRSKLIDTEAIIVLYRLITTEKRVTLKNPPPIFSEAIRILGLDDLFKLDLMVEKEGQENIVQYNY